LAHFFALSTMTNETPLPSAATSSGRSPPSPSNAVDRRRKKQAMYDRHVQANKIMATTTPKQETNKRGGAGYDATAGPDDEMMQDKSSGPSASSPTSKGSPRTRTLQERRGPRRYDDQTLFKRVELVKKHSERRPADSNEDEQKKTSQWDTRSVLDEGIERLEELDTSWNPSVTSHFDTSAEDSFSSPTKPDVASLDMFDMESWTGADNVFSTFASSGEPFMNKHGPEDSEFDARWEAVKRKEREDSWNATNGLPSQTKESPKKAKDDEPLLALDEVRSDVLDSSECQNGAQAAEEQTRLQKARLEGYSAEKEKDDESSGGDGEGSDSDDDSDKEVKYISADSGDEDEDEKSGISDDASDAAILAGTNDSSVKYVATDGGDSGIPDDASDSAILAGIKDSSTQKFASFHAADAAASAKNQISPVKETMAPVELENLEIVRRGVCRDETDSKAGGSVFPATVMSSLAGEKLLGSVSSHKTGATDIRSSSVTENPPAVVNDTEATPTVSNSKKPTTDKTIFKIAPPPEEKLRKWEEEKARPFKHLRAISKTKSEESAPDKTPPEITRKLFPADLSAASHESSGHEGGDTIGSSASLDRRRSPTIYDGRIAEKLIMASSEAADKFESFVAHDGIKSTIPLSLTASKSVQDRESHNTIADLDEQQNEKTEPSFFCAPDAFRDNIISMTNSSLGINELTGVCSGKPERSRSMDADDARTPIKANRSMVELGSTPVSTTNSTDLDRGVELVGGAFSPWRNAGFAPVSESVREAYDKKAVAQANAAAAHVLTSHKSLADEVQDRDASEESLLSWLQNDVLGKSPDVDLANTFALSPQQAKRQIAALLERDEYLNTLCQHVFDIVKTAYNDALSAAQTPPGAESDMIPSSTVSTLQPFTLPSHEDRPAARVIAANFVSFLSRVGKKSGLESPFGDENPFLLDIVEQSIKRAGEGKISMEEDDDESVQRLIFNHLEGGTVPIIRFFHSVCCSAKRAKRANQETPGALPTQENAQHTKTDDEALNPRFRVPEESPSPFEVTCQALPSIVVTIVGFLGDPVVVCRAKMVNETWLAIVSENEHVMMRDAVRCGGMSMNVRPAFWLWISLEKCAPQVRRPQVTEMNNKLAPGPELDGNRADEAPNSGPVASASLPALEKIGREGKWHNVIQRDVGRAFGNMPPHKTGARLRTDSIVRALVTWGRGRLLKRGTKGKNSSLGSHEESDVDNADQEPAEKVSDWGGISPVGSFSSSVTGGAGETNGKARISRAGTPNEASGGKPQPSKLIEELALSGNALTEEMKVDLQNQLGFILHALAAAHEDVGYCQGMDYIVAHLLRVLQDTVRWQAVRGTLPAAVHARPEIPETVDDDQSLTLRIDEAIDKSLVVEETVFRVMDTFFTTYNLRHMFWPELRCLKTCCRVFERLIQIKLPVLADHFEHHDLNVGLFALGWFQTLFLYLPSMPSQTVCHMWDIWLVERSFKIFFRVGTAILFLSQPILLNHELEGMMTYLNTFPDATLLKPDILIACALQIKVTNRLLEEIEEELTVL
jgi:hypothetical protein